MQRALFIAGALIAMTGAAAAADLPNSKGPPSFAPPPPPVFSWTGLYIGGQVGIQWGQTGWNRYDATNTAFLAAEDPYANNGVVGGGHIGYNLQMSQFVLGVEGDVEGTNYNGNGLSNANTWANTTRADIEASIRARVGFAWDRLLIYATGGGAFGGLHNTAENPPGTFYAGDDYNHIGWTAGGGIEYAIDQNWSLRIEDRVTDYGRHTFFTGTENIHEDEWNNRIEAGFSYKFDMFAPPTPVVAKY